MVSSRSSDSGLPLWKLRYIVSAPKGSTPYTSHSGFISLIAVATPDASPPPPIGTITAVRTNEAALESTVDISMFANLNDLVYADVVLWKPAG